MRKLDLWWGRQSQRWIDWLDEHPYQGLAGFLVIYAVIAFVAGALVF